MQNNSPIKQRILQFVDTLGISKRDFYNVTGISRGTLESKTGITEDTLAKFFATYKDVNPTWVLTGKGEIKIPSEENILNDVDPPPYGGVCKSCIEKERIIEALQDSLKTKDIAVNSLIDQIELLKKQIFEAHQNKGEQKRKAG